jgi:hypothetical protein
LPGAFVPRFTERRMSVFCRWSYSDGAPYFTIALLSDFAAPAQGWDDSLVNWEDRRFAVRGKNAGYHLLQSTIHYMLTRWEKEWSECLEALGNGVKTKVRDTVVPASRWSCAHAGDSSRTSSAMRSAPS